MTSTDNAADDLMRRRVERVATVSALTATALKLTQAAAGMEMEILRLEMEILRNPANGKLAQELLETENNAAAMRKAQADCAGDIAAAERKVAALDELIATAKGE
ncbi:hypothetical protein [Pararhizobium sp. LjRoot238]|uniref:hypothetical protein n=1 Tax=Pararhizobium sp. LjRoot238 TaxID=3342293 RepID=UPI003ECDFD3B